MLESGADVRSIMAITGHKSVAMFQRYSHPTFTHLKRTVEALSEDSLVSNLGTVAEGDQGGPA
jgi:hypothetical protein